jgi:hypothetical protein
MRTLCAAFAALAVASLLATSAAAKLEQGRTIDPNNSVIQRDKSVVAQAAVCRFNNGRTYKGPDPRWAHPTSGACGTEPKR